MGTINKILLSLTVIVALAAVLMGSGVVPAAYSLIQNGGSPLTMRPTLNCSTGTTCTDDAAHNRTNITASGSSGLPIQANGTPVATATTLNFDNGSNTTVSCSNSSGTVTCTYNSSGGGGTTVTALPPYIELGSTLYTAYNMYAVTLPTSPTYLNSVSCSSSTTAANGDLVVSSTTNCWGGYTAATSIEGDFACIAVTNDANCGLWMWDSTNNHIWYLTVNNANSSGGPWLTNVEEYSYNGSGNPSFSSTLLTINVSQVPNHYKLSVSGGTITFALSVNGGVTFTTVYSTTGIGTISKAGFAVTVSSSTSGMDVYSLVIS